MYSSEISAEELAVGFEICDTKCQSDVAQNHLTTNRGAILRCGDSNRIIKVRDPDGRVGYQLQMRRRPLVTPDEWLPVKTYFDCAPESIPELIKKLKLSEDHDDADEPFEAWVEQIKTFRFADEMQIYATILSLASIVGIGAVALKAVFWDNILPDGGFGAFVGFHLILVLVIIMSFIAFASITAVLYRLRVIPWLRIGFNALVLGLCCVALFYLTRE